MELGDRVYFYFAEQRIPEIRQALGAPEVTDETIKKLFFEFVEEMDMSASYKPVLMLAFLDAASSQGRAHMADVVAKFRTFYETRVKTSLQIERPTMRMARVAELSDADVQNVIVSMPLKKFMQRRYMEYMRDVANVQFNRALWKQLTDEDFARTRELCRQSIEKYYGRLTTTPP